jgi:DNA polymerase elongation subunit (family B)
MEANTHIHCFETEEQLMEAFQKTLREEDPDIIADYNGFGFDYQYWLARSNQLRQNGSLACWGRLREDEEDASLTTKKVVFAAGAFDLKFFEVEGRFQMDMMVVMRREEILDSYSLNNVSSTFIRGEVLSRDGTVVLSKKDLGGLKPGDYIRFEVVKNSPTPLLDGHKFMVTDVKGKHFTLAQELIVAAEDVPFLHWCRVKDDLDPQDIFRCQHGTDAERGRIAKYCIMDCNLVLDLMAKLQKLDNARAMANVCGVTLPDIYLRGQGIKSHALIVRECAKAGQIVRALPSGDHEDNGGDDVGYLGALVIDPITGVYMDEPVAVIDYNSLYPSEMRARNYSHDAWVRVTRYDMEGNIISIQENKGFADLPDETYFDRTFTEIDDKKNPVGTTTVRWRQAKGPDDVGTLTRIQTMLVTKRKEVRKLADREEDEFVKGILNAQQLAFKVTANSIYGQMGSSVGPVRMLFIAACTTAGGQEMLRTAKTTAESMGATVVYGDSVTGDTALVLEINGILTTRRIDELVPPAAWTPYGDEKEAVELPDTVRVWTENGFTHVRRVIRHLCNKRLFRVVTHAGIVDVTEDHSLLDPEGNKVRPTDVAVGSALLHAATLPTTSVGAPNDVITNKNVAFNLGTLMAQGMKHAWMPGGHKNKHNEHIVPSQILAASREVAESFLHGLRFSGGELRASGKESCTSIQLLAARLCYRVNVAEDFTLHFAIDETAKESTIISIRELPSTTDFVYDLETESHHFHVGPGRMVVHNTDSIFMKFKLPPGLDHVAKREETLKKAVEVAAAINAIVPRPHNIEYEKQFSPFILLRAKGYVGIMYEDDVRKGKKKFMGVVLKRRDNPDIVKDIYGGAIDHILYDRDVKKAQAFVKDALTDLIHGEIPLEKLVLSKSLKELSSYKAPQTVAHLQLARRMAMRDPANRPRSGDRIQFVFVQNPKATKTGDKMESIDYVRAHQDTLKIDYLHYLTDQIQNPVAQVFRLVIEELDGFTKTPKGRYFAALRTGMLAKGDKTQEEVDRYIEREKDKILNAIMFKDAPHLQYQVKELATQRTGQQTISSMFTGGAAPRAPHGSKVPPKKASGGAAGGAGH